MRTTRNVPTFACTVDKYGRPAPEKRYRLDNTHVGSIGDDGFLRHSPHFRDDKTAGEVYIPDASPHLSRSADSAAINPKNFETPKSNRLSVKDPLTTHKVVISNDDFNSVVYFRNQEETDFIKFPLTALQKPIPVEYGGFSVAINYYNGINDAYPPYIIYTTKKETDTDWGDFKIAWVMYISMSNPISFPLSTNRDNPEIAIHFLFIVEGPDSELAYIHVKHRSDDSLRTEEGDDKKNVCLYQSCLVLAKDKASEPMHDFADLEIDRGAIKAFKRSRSIGDQGAFDGRDFISGKLGEHIDGLADNRNLYETHANSDAIDIITTVQPHYYCFGRLEPSEGTQDELCLFQLTFTESSQDIGTSPIRKRIASAGDRRYDIGVNKIYSLASAKNFADLPGNFFEMIERKMKIPNIDSLRYSPTEARYSDTSIRKAAAAESTCRFVHNIHVLSNLQTAQRLVAIFDNEA